MTCTECGRATVSFAVPEDLREYVPENASAAAMCVSCLTLQPPPRDATIREDPDLTEVSEAFPEDSHTAIAVALTVGLMESLALNRPKIEELIDRIEDEGADALLVMERLAEDPALNPAIDLLGRRRQLQQLMS